MQTEFIQNRINYLETLKNLSDDWINGNSVSPSRETIDNAIRIFRVIAESKLYNNIETLMSPTPAGDITFEIYTDDTRLLLIVEALPQEIE